MRVSAIWAMTSGFLSPAIRASNVRRDALPSTSAGDRVELDAGPLQQLLDALGLPGPFLAQLGALAAGQVLDVAGVDQQQLDAGHGLEDMPHRAPVGTGRLHGHLADPLGAQPVRNFSRSPVKAANSFTC